MVMWRSWSVLHKTIIVSQCLCHHLLKKMHFASFSDSAICSFSRPVHSFTQISPQYWMFLLESISFKFLISLIMTVLMVFCPCWLWWRVLSGLNSRGPQVIHIYTHDIIVNLYWYILMDWGTQENSLPASLSLWKC